MSGNAVSSGAEYQAAVAAYVATKILSHTRLNWLEPADDTPIAVSGETGGAGDDLRIELLGSRVVIEVQCKRALTGRSATAQAVKEIASRLVAAPPDLQVILAVGPGSNADVRDDFATDLRHFRQGRTDLRHVARHVIEVVPNAREAMQRLHVVSVDAATQAGGATQVALQSLRTVLREPSGAESAWSLLVREGLRLNQRGRWDRAFLERLLTTAGLLLRPVGPEANWMERIDHARDLTLRYRPRTAAGLLEDLAQELQSKSASNTVRRRLHGTLGSSYFALERWIDAEAEFARALDYVESVDAVAAGEATSDDSDDRRKAWSDAHFNYAAALAALTRADEAHTRLQEVLVIHPTHCLGWSLMAQLSDLRRMPEVSPPAEVVECADFLLALAQNAARVDAWQRVRELTRSLLDRGERGPRIATLYANAILNLASQKSTEAERASGAAEAERLANEAVGVLRNGELDRALGRALLIRGYARQMQHKTDAAADDLDRASQLIPDDINVLRRAVELKQQSGDLEGALAMLGDARVGISLHLRILRARVRTALADREGAERDLEFALNSLAASAGASVETYLEIAEAASIVRSWPLVDRALLSVAKSGGASKPTYFLLHGRLLFAREEFALGETEYRRAIELLIDVEAQQAARAEFAHRLWACGDHLGALRVFRELGADSPEHESFPAYFRVLFEAEQYAEVLALIESGCAAARNDGRGLDALPRYQLEAGADIAWRQGDFHTVAIYLEAICTQHQAVSQPPPIAMLLSLVHAYLRISEAQSAIRWLDVLTGRPDITPEERMAAGHLYVQAQLPAQGIDEAFLAFRERPNDKQSLTQFVGIVSQAGIQRSGMLEAPTAPQEANGNGASESMATDADQAASDPNDIVANDGIEGTVAANTFVRLVGPGGQRLEYLIYASGPVNRALNEHFVSDPEVRDIIGKTVGETVIRNASSWAASAWRVERVLPAVVYMFRRAMQTVSTRFAGETGFLMVHVGREPTLEALAPLRAALRANADQRESVLQQYGRHLLPLGTVARKLGVSLAALARTLASDPNLPVKTEDAALQPPERSAALAEEATSVVLTRPALVFLEELDLLPVLLDHADLLLPQSLLQDIENEIDELSDLAARGRTSIGEAGIGFSIQSLEPGAMTGALESLVRLRDTLVGRAAIAPRPLDSLTERDEKLRQLLGDSSLDAIAVARARRATLYADDLALRVIALREYAVPSFSTSALVEGLHAKGHLALDALDQATTRLIRWGHQNVPFRASTLARVLSRSPEQPADRRLLLSALAGPTGDHRAAVVVGLGALRLCATVAVSVTPFADAASSVVRALFEGRLAADVYPIMTDVARSVFYLLPTHLRRVLGTIEAEARARGVIVAG